MKNSPAGGSSGFALYSLISLEDFKALLSVDDREDALSRYCLVTATYTIEQYCKRQLLKKKHSETFDFMGDYVFPLRDYPVREVLIIRNEQVLKSKEQGEMSKGELIGAKFYRVIPECGDLEDLPVCLWVSPALRLIRGALFKVRYWAGYSAGKVPPDLGSACLELAAWNMSRYRGRRIGMTGAEGEHLEGSMPENVRQLLEPYRRKTI